MYNITFTPDISGNSQTIMTLASNDPDTPVLSVSLDGSGACHGWAWFRPPAVPQGVVCRLADGVSATLRELAMVTGIEPVAVSMCVVFGTPCGGPSIRRGRRGA